MVRRSPPAPRRFSKFTTAARLRRRLATSRSAARMPSIPDYQLSDPSGHARRRGRPLDLGAVSSERGREPPAGVGQLGGRPADAALRVSAGTVSAYAGLFGLVLSGTRSEPTLGQVLHVLGYAVNVGTALTDTVSTNDMNPVAQGEERRERGAVREGGGRLGFALSGRPVFSHKGICPTAGIRRTRRRQ